MDELELLRLFYESYTLKWGRIHKTYLGTGRTIILDKLFAKIEEYRREYPPNEVNQVLSNVREAIEASEDKEALWFWGY
jgi:hypothetical protein